MNGTPLVRHGTVTGVSYTGMAFHWYFSPAWMIAFPLFGAVLLLLFGKRVGKRAGVVASALLGLSFVWAAIVFAAQLSTTAHDRTSLVHLWDWINVGTFHANVDLFTDPLAIVMALVITGVGTLIHIYSIDYMAGDPRYPRFFAYMNLFAASMLLLVLANNVVLLYVGWEGVGVCSYLLIGFWFERRSASNAAKKAFLVNRIGDFAFLLGIFLLAKAVGSVGITTINDAAAAPFRSGLATTAVLGTGIATIAAFLLLAGATGKSAQIPLYVWLPDAMEGPTPVSALLHAATMVTAGVYLVARFSPLFASAGAALHAVAWVGGITALFAALMAATEYDIKRVLAYSTISQIGYMFVGNGVEASAAAIFHFVTHAFFKALLFLGAGAIMHALAGEIDMRKMGGLRKAMPVVAWTFGIGALAISGIFPFAGFWSKDAILASAWAHGQYALWAIGIATAFLTAFYMFRLYFRVFEGDLVVPEGAHPHDAPLLMKAALIPLAIGSVFVGAVNLPHFLTLEHFMEPALGTSAVPAGLAPWFLTGAALVIAVAGIALAYALYMAPEGTQRRARLGAALPWLVESARNKFYVDEAYGALIVLPGKRVATFFASVVDARVIDGAVNGIAGLFGGLADGVRRIQTGYVRNYAVTFFFGAVVIFSIVVLTVVRT